MDTPYTPGPFSPANGGFPCTPSNMNATTPYEYTAGGLFGLSKPPSPQTVGVSQEGSLPGQPPQNAEESQEDGSFAGPAPTSPVTPRSVPANVVDINYQEAPAKQESKRKRRAGKNTGQQIEGAKQPKTRTYDRYYGRHWDKHRIEEPIEALPDDSNPWKTSGNFRASHTGEAATIPAPPLASDAGIAYNPGNGPSGALAQQQMQQAVQVTPSVASSNRTKKEIDVAWGYLKDKEKQLVSYKRMVEGHTESVRQFVHNHNQLYQKYNETTSQLSANVADRLYSSMMEERQWLDTQHKWGEHLMAVNRSMWTTYHNRLASLQADRDWFMQYYAPH